MPAIIHSFSEPSRVESSRECWKRMWMRRNKKIKRQRNARDAKKTTKNARKY